MNLILFNILNDFKLSQNQESFKSQNQVEFSFGDILSLLIQFFTSRGENILGDGCLKKEKQIEDVSEKFYNSSFNSSFNFQSVRSTQESKNDNSIITEAIDSPFEQSDLNKLGVLELKLIHLANKWVMNQGFDVFEIPQFKISDGENVNAYSQMNSRKDEIFNVDAFVRLGQKQNGKSQVISTEGNQTNQISEAIKPEICISKSTYFDLNEIQSLFEKKSLEDLNRSESVKSEKLQLRTKEEHFQGERIKHDSDVLEKSQFWRNLEHEQAKNNFDSSHKLKKDFSNNIEFEKVVVKNFNSIDVTSFDREVNLKGFNLSVRVQDIPEVLKDFVLKSDIIDREVIVLKVEPREIGEVVIKISEGENGVRILFEVKNLEAKQIIESGFENLKGMLESNNVDLEKIETLITGGSFANDDLNSLSPEREKFPKRFNRRKMFDSSEIVKIYGGSLIEAII